MGFPLPPAFEDIREGARAFVDAGRLAEGLLRITVTAPRDAGHGGTLAITARPLPEFPEEFSLQVCTSVRRVPSPLSRCKTISRAAEAFALREALRAGASDAILLNPDGRIVETTARNVFVVEEGIARTPPPSDGALEGITRAAVLELAKELAVPVEEVSIPADALRTVDEVFVTGSGVGVRGVDRVDGRSFPAAPGPVTARLARGYARLLDAESKW